MIKTYTVKKCSKSISIDADWDKLFWHDAESIPVDIHHWPVQSKHIPKTQVKLQYDADNLYVIFRVQDCYIRAVTLDINGEVWKDSCVEFFFAPCTEKPDSYFNLEINCCGVLLAQHHTGPRQNSRFLDLDDCRKIRISSTASGPIRHEIAKPLTWTLEYAVPLDILTHYADIDRPASGVCWKANFYKCADDSSHPHWMSWSPVSCNQPDFHRPDCFGVLKFI